MTAAEEWRPVVGWEDFYEVSSHGRVRSLTRCYFDSVGRWRVFKGKVIAGTLDDGYCVVTLSRKQGEQQIYKIRFVHHLVLESFHGPRPIGYGTRHLNGIPADNRMENLAWGTQQENNDDKFLHGTHNRCWMCYKPRKSKKLTEDQIREIRASGTPIPVAAKEYGVPKQMIYRIRTGRAWASLV